VRDNVESDLTVGMPVSFRVEVWLPEPSDAVLEVEITAAFLVVSYNIEF
jgi:hypothetical protein